MEIKNPDYIKKLIITAITIVAVVWGYILADNYITRSKSNTEIEQQYLENLNPDMLEEEPQQETKPEPVKNVEPVDKESVPKSDFKVPEIG